jgi:hypothetical protein
MLFRAAEDSSEKAVKIMTIKRLEKHEIMLQGIGSYHPNNYVREMWIREHLMKLCREIRFYLFVTLQVAMFQKIT